MQWAMGASGEGSVSGVVKRDEVVYVCVNVLLLRGLSVSKQVWLHNCSG